MKIQKSIAAAWAACKQKVKESFENSTGADIPERKEQEGPYPTEPMELKFHFPQKLESNLAQINRKLDRYFFSSVTIDVERSKTYLATETKRNAATGEKTVRYWMGFDECVLCCEPPKEGEAFRFQINTMTADKSEPDCGKLWERTYPEQQQRHLVVRDYGDRYGVLVAYHAKIKKAVEPAPQEMPVQKAQAAPAAPQLVQTVGRCGDTLTWSLVEDTLYIQGYGEMSYRTSNWFPGGDRIRKAIVMPGCTEIGNAAFEGCTGLTSVMIPDTVTRIRWSAFRGCKSLTEILLPNSVTEIGDFAFHGCSGLTRVEIPGSVKQIGGKAFSGCTGLKNLVIPDSVWKIGLEAFQDVLHIQYTGSAVSENNWGAKNRNGGNRMPEPIPIPAPEPAAKKASPEPIPISAPEPAAKKASPEPTPIPAPEPVTKKDPMEPFTLEFHFPDRKEADLDRINEALAKHTLSGIRVDLGKTKFYLATQTTNDIAAGTTSRRYWLGLDDCVLHCVPAKDGEGTQYQVSTMTAEKTEKDRAALWRSRNPGRLVHQLAEIEYHAAFGVFVIHHEKKAEPVKPVQPPKSAACREFRKPAKFWNLENDILTVTHSGSLRAFLSEEEKQRVRKVILSEGCTRIGRRVFAECPQLEAVLLPQSLRIIAEEAFRGCGKLRTIVLPEYLIGLDNGTFRECTGLRRIRIPNRITILPDNLFRDCTSLEWVLYPDYIRKMGEYVFEGSSPKHIRGLRTYRHNYRYFAYDWNMDSKDGVLLDPEKHCLIAMTDSGQKTYIVPEGVTSIADQAFENCTGLESVYIPDSVKQIGAFAFHGCESLRQVRLPEGITQIEEGTFEDCRSLEKIVISKTVERIASWAFTGCKSMKSLEIPEGVTEIGNNAFWNVPEICYGGPAKSPNNWGALVRKWGILVGKCGNNLTWRLEGNTLTISGKGRIKKTDDYWEEEIPRIKHLVIKPGCTAIARDVFRDHINLETIQLPDTLQIIAAHAFSGCTSLLAAELPDSVFGLGIGAFSHCEKLHTVKLSHRLREISPETFHKCGSLEKVWIPDEVTTIGDLAFAGTKSLRTLPKRLKHLGERALSGTTLLEDNFPTGLATIGPYAFCNTKGLTEVRLTSCMEKIAPHAFLNCSDLRKVWIGSGITEIGEWAFDGCEELETVHIGSDVHTIGRYAFCGCRLKSVSIPDSVTKIESYVFHWCKQLSDLKLGSNINIIGAEAFSHCPLETVQIPAGVSFIGRKAFLGAKHIMYNGPLMSEDNWGACKLTTEKQSQAATPLFNAMYNMHQHECWGHKITEDPKLVQQLNQIHHSLTYGDIPEVDCPTVIRLLMKNPGHAQNWTTVRFADYHYDDNGILRKMETTNPDYHNIPANEALVDVRVFDENGSILRHCPAFVDFSKSSFLQIPPVLTIYSGAIRNGQYGYERYELTVENLYSETLRPKPFAKDSQELFWRTNVPDAGEMRTVDYWFGREVFPNAPGWEKWCFRVLKCSPQYKDRLEEYMKKSTGE